MARSPLPKTLRIHVYVCVSLFAVAFSVKFSADPIANVGVGSTLKFDRVVHNLGGSYDTQTGIFTAPTPGTYAFFLGLMGSDTQGAVELAIIR